MSTVAFKKRGNPKGCPKILGSGRKRGTPNHVTRLKQEMNNPLTPEETCIRIKKTLAELALEGNVNAAKAWFEDYHRPLPPKIRCEVSSFDDLDRAGELVLKETLQGKLDIPTAERLMGMLLRKRELRAGALLPLMEELIEKQKEVNKARRP